MKKVIAKAKQYESKKSLDGKMTRFRKDDVVVGGTNLGGGDNTEVVALLKELIITVKSGGNVYLDGTKVGTAMAMSTYKS